jgi:hypothetical protein
MDVILAAICCSPTDAYRLLDAAKSGNAVEVQNMVEKRPSLVRKAQQWGKHVPVCTKVQPTKVQAAAVC